MPSKPDPVDIHVGGRVRLRRMLIGMSQEKLGQGIGLTFQKIQKYERDANRIGSSRLFRLSQVLDVPVSFFFDDMHSAISGVGVGEGGQSPFEADYFQRRESQELLRYYYRIGDALVHKRVLGLVKAVATARPDPENGASPGAEKKGSSGNIVKG